MGSKRQRPLHPPQGLYSQDDTNMRHRDPFRTPDPSVPPTPHSGVSNPFSPPASVRNFSSEQNLHSAHHSSGSASYFPFPPPADSPPSSRPHTGASRVSAHSSLRNSSTDLHVTIREGPRGIARSRRSSVNGHVRNSGMSPPAMPRRATVLFGDGADGSAGTLLAPPRAAKRQRSSMLLGEVAKPWVTDKDFYGRLSYWLTVSVAVLGIIGSGIRVYFSWAQSPRVGNLCLVMEDNFDTFDTAYTWFQEVDMSGFGCVRSSQVCD